MNKGIRLILTKCYKCLGCNKLECENFRGDNDCKNYVPAFREELKQQEISRITKGN